MVAAAYAKETPVDIKRMLHEHIRYSEAERDPANFHASDVTREDPAWCARSAVLKKKVNAPPKMTHVPTAMAVTWDWGRLVEERVRDRFADMGRLVGDWQCRHAPCKRMYPWQKRPIVCSECNGDLFKYHERRAISNFSGISCGLDLLVNTGAAKLMLGEVKSMDKDKFKDLCGPLAEHRLRTNLYLRAIAESEDPMLGRVNNQTAFVLYVSKGGYGTLAPEMVDWPFQDGKFSPFKVYYIKRDDEQTQSMSEQVRGARSALAGDGPIPKRICQSHINPRAQNCSVMSTCFSSDKW